MASFDEKISMCLENIIEFAHMINEIHSVNDTFQYDLEDCEIKMFSEELNRYFHLRRSPRLTKNFFLCLCKKYPQTFNDSFLIAKNDKLL